MKKHHRFERRKTKILLMTALTTAAVCSFASCAEHSELPVPPDSMSESTYQTEHTMMTETTEESADAVAEETEIDTPISSQSTSGLPAIPESTQESTPLATTAPEEETTAPSPVIRTEKTEEYISISQDTFYEYSVLYDKGTTVLIQEGRSGTLLRVTEVIFKDDVAIDSIVTETIISEPIARVYAVGIKSEITYETITITDHPIPFQTETIRDSNLYDDETVVRQEGAEGYTELTYRITYENGVEISREETAREIVAPQTHVVAVGTKPAWTEQTVTERENSVPYETTYIYDDTLEEGKRIVKTAGENGYTACSYRLRYYRGSLSSKELQSRTVYEPKTEVVAIGIKKADSSFGLPFYTGRGYTLTQDFGGSHYAMDFGVWYGDPILSIGEGTVIYAYDEGDFPKTDMNWTYGTFVVIEHKNGIRSLYAHLKSRTVRAGQKVSKGQVIGYSGNTGRVNPVPTPSNPLAGTHLHFEIRVNNIKVDPKDYIPDF